MNTRINLFITFYILGCIALAQNLEVDTIYLDFTTDNKCPRKLKFFKKGEKGLVFNLSCTGNGTVLYKKKDNTDTLLIEKMSNYKTITPEEVIDIEKEWRKKNKPKLIEKFGFPYPIYDKNEIFKTYLIEVLEDKDKFIIYPVTWRNLGQKK